MLAPILSLSRTRLIPSWSQPGGRLELGFWAVALTFFVIAAVLRLIWVQDIEYKADESTTYETVRAVRAGAPWPQLGAPSSQLVPAHPMMIWVFLAIDRVSPADSPPELARTCQCLNLLAIAGLLVFIRVSVPPESRAVWLWGAALAVVNPLAVVLQRKIWCVSITPPFLVLVLVGFWYRDRRWGAGLWGGMVLLVGMIHAGGLLLAVGLAGWALAFDRSRVQWRWWLVASAVVGCGLIPWVLAVAGTHTPSTGQIRWTNPLTFNYWMRWATEPLGISVHYNLGKDFADFLRYPLVGGRGTYLMAVAHVALAVVAAAVLLGGAVRAWRYRRDLSRWVLGGDAKTLAVVGAVWIGFGLVLSLSCVPIHRHYMIMTFPMMYVWVAVVALSDRRPLIRGWTHGQALLLASCVLQLVVSACLLAYIHDSHRTIRGDYGTPYAAQVQSGLPPR